MTTHDKMAALLASAAHLGADYKAKQADIETDARKRSEAATFAAARVEDDKFSASGFDSLRYKGLTQMGRDLQAAFNTDSQERRDTARGMADAFMASFTGATQATLKGGKQAGYANVITLGDNAERCRMALQSRLLHWRGVKASAAEIEDAKDKAAVIAEANRYLVPCGAAPNEDGSHPTDREGKKQTPKFNGRPACNINGVPIPFGRGTDRDAQMAAFALLFADHGDKVLAPEVCDAFLDNGGRYKASGDKTVADLANDALAAIDGLLGSGGKESGDGAFLVLAASLFGRIAKEGLKGSATVSVADSTPEEESKPEPEATDAGSAAEVLAEVTSPEPATVDGPGITLGGAAPTAPARPKRNRKEVKAA